MRTHTTKRRGGLVLAGVAAVTLMGGTAFTDATVFEDTAAVEDVVGHGESTVSGATVKALDYTIDGANVTGLTVTFSETFHAKPTVSVVVNEGTATCSTTTEGMFSDWSCTLVGTTVAGLTSTAITVEGAKDEL